MENFRTAIRSKATRNRREHYAPKDEDDSPADATIHQHNRDEKASAVLRKGPSESKLAHKHVTRNKDHHEENAEHADPHANRHFHLDERPPVKLSEFNKDR